MAFLNLNPSITVVHKVPIKRLNEEQAFDDLWYNVLSFKFPSSSLKEKFVSNCEKTNGLIYYYQNSNIILYFKYSNKYNFFTNVCIHVTSLHSSPVDDSHPGGCIILCLNYKVMFVYLYIFICYVGV